MILEPKKTDPVDKAEIKERVNALRNFYKQNGAEKMTDKELLTLLLSFCMGIKDCFSVAEYLLYRFGSYTNLINTDLEVLLSLPFMSANAALLLKSIPELCRRELIEERPKRLKIKTPEDAEKYLFPYFLGYDNEMAFLLLLKENYAPIKVAKIARGETQSIYISAETVVRQAVISNAAYCILSHSHPGGKAKPSREDEVATYKISTTLSHFNVTLLDHLIFSLDDCYYMSKGKVFDGDILGFAKENTKQK